MIELIKFAYTFEYIHKIIKNNITENKWDNCLVVYDSIKTFILDSSFEVTIDKDNELVKVIDRTKVIICMFEKNISDKPIMDCDLLIIFNKEKYKLFSLEKFDKNSKFIGCMLANTQVMNLARKDYYLLSTLVAMYYEKIKSCLSEFLFNCILFNNRISFDKNKYKTGDLLDICNEKIIKKYKNFIVTENYIVISEDNYLYYYRMDLFSKEEKEKLAGKGSLEASLYNLTLSKMEEKELITDNEITKLKEIKKTRDRVSHENYNLVYIVTTDEIVNYGNEYIKKIKLMQTILKRIKRVYVEFDFMEVAQKMTREEYESIVNSNTEEDLLSFTDSIINNFNNNLIIYNK